MDVSVRLRPAVHLSEVPRAGSGIDRSLQGLNQTSARPDYGITIALLSATQFVAAVNIIGKSQKTNPSGFSAKKLIVRSYRVFLHNRPMSTENDTLQRQWLMLRLIPRYPRKADARSITDRLQSEGYRVSKRTIERDLKMLSEKFPLLLDDREKPFGWSWRKDAATIDIPGMSPVEALVFMLVQAHSRPLFPATMLAKLDPYFNQAAITLGKAESLSTMSRWSDKIAMVPPMQPLISPNCPPEIVETIHEGILYEKQLQTRYLSRATGGVRDYLLHPLGLVIRGVVSYLVATVETYDDPRFFALHRFNQVKLLDEQRRKPEGFEIAELIASGSFGFGSQGRISLVLRMLADAAEHLYETPLSDDQEITACGNGKVLVSATVNNTQQLRWWILGFGEMAEVISPPTLRHEFHCSALQMLHNYEKPDNDITSTS